MMAATERAVRSAECRMRDIPRVAASEVECWSLGGVALLEK